MSKDRKKRNLELLKNAVDKDRNGSAAPGGGGGGAPGAPGGGAGGQIMYRGRPVGNGRGGGAPGSPGSGGGQGRPAPKAAASGDDGDVKEALRKLTQLFNDGLITTAEYDAKRAEILNRL